MAKVKLENLKQELANLIYLNEETMVCPFDDYQEQRSKLEKKIQQLEKVGA